MANDKPKRPWFQIHLSTGIALMLVCSLLLFPPVLVYRSLHDKFSLSHWEHLREFCIQFWYYPVLCFPFLLATYWFGESLNRRKRGGWK